jgi:FAD/FMN-containing dehydrogenase
MPPLARIVRNDQSEWTNKHLNFSLPIDRLYDIWNPDTTDLVAGLQGTTKALQGLIQEAIDDGQRLRALGNGWSFSRVAYTDGRLLNTLPLNWHFDISDASRAAAYQGDPASLLFVQCGTAILEVNRILEARGRSLPGSGASNGQSIAGALSTGTHGSAYKAGAIPDFVVGLHLIVGADRHVWLERASYPVASDHFVSLLGAEAIRDDALFNAALVSFGSFGIIHGVMLESVPLFYLRKHREWLPLSDGLKAAMRTLDFSGVALPGGSSDPYHFEMVVNPHRDDDQVYLRVVTMEPPPSDSDTDIDTDTDPGDDDTTETEFGDDIPGFIGELVDMAPAAVPLLVNQLIGDRLNTGSTRVKTLGDLFDSSSTHGRVASMALAIPAHHSPEALDLLRDRHSQDGPFAGVFAFRWVPPTKATLGFQHFEPLTCVVEMDGLDDDASRDFRHGVVNAIEAAGIPFTFHWGKINDEMTPARLRAGYGDAAIDSWLSARSQLLSAPCREVFTNPFLRSIGLD